MWKSFFPDKTNTPIDNTNIEDDEKISKTDDNDDLRQKEDDESEESGHGELYDDYIYENESDDDIYGDDEINDDSIINDYENEIESESESESEEDESQNDTSEEDDENDTSLSWVNPSVQHIYSNKPYYYELEATIHNSPLTLELKGEDTPIEYYLYMYIIVNNRDKPPYILCLLEYHDNMEIYNFPKISYTPYHSKQTVNEEHEHKEDDNHTIEINNLCFSKLSSVFTINETDIHDNNLFQEDEYLMKNILHHNSNNIIPIRCDSYVQYLKSNATDKSITNLSQFYSTNDKNKPPQYAWCSLDELKRKQRVYNHAIHLDVYDLFSKHKLYYTIYDENHSIVEIPQMMYSCHISKKNMKFTTETEESSLLPKMSQYKDYGDMYFFSDDLLDKNENIYKIPRYIVFIGETGMVGTNDDKGDDNGNDDSLVNDLNENDLIYSSVKFPYTIQTESNKEKTTIVGVVSPEWFYNF